MYKREITTEQFKFLNERVLQNKVLGIILGPPGTGKSVSTLAFLLSLDHTLWEVIWIHLGEVDCPSFKLNPNEAYENVDIENYSFPTRQRGDTRTRIICLDGFKNNEDHDRLLLHIRLLSPLEEKRIICCSSVAVLGKRNAENDEYSHIEVFTVVSWTKSEYFDALKDPTFYESIKPKLDAQDSLSFALPEIKNVTKEEKIALNYKYYFAGGSSRFMFGYGTAKVKELLKFAMDNVKDKSKLIKADPGIYAKHQINHLYGVIKVSENDGTGFTELVKHIVISSYAMDLISDSCSANVIKSLAMKLNSSDNPALDGIIYEWYFFACINKKDLTLVDQQGNKETLPSGPIVKFDPSFTLIQSKHNNCWLRPRLESGWLRRHLH